MKALAHHLVSPVVALIVLVMTIAWFAYALHHADDEVARTQAELRAAEQANTARHAASDRDRADLRKRLDTDHAAVMKALRKLEARP